MSRADAPGPTTPKCYGVAIKDSTGRETRSQRICQVQEFWHAPGDACGSAPS